MATAQELVISIGKEFGRRVLPESADYILMEHTGFPCFFNPFPGETDIDVLKRQIRCYFQGANVVSLPYYRRNTRTVVRR